MIREKMQCAHCGNTDYCDNPGPWFFAPLYGWVCSIDCWVACIKERIAREEVTG